MEVEGLRALVRDVRDFPRPGIVFKDLTPLFAHPEGLACVVDALSEHFSGRPVDKVVGIEARGFIVAAPIAAKRRAGFVAVRKPGKLPWEAEGEPYELEYGTDQLEVHRDGVQPGEHVLVVDDVMATGGTLAAAVRLVERLGGTVTGVGVVVELAFLGGRAKLEGYDVCSLVVYDRE